MTNVETIKFQVRIRHTYYHMGVLNVPIKHSMDFLPNEKYKLKIELENFSEVISGRISRGINKNSTPRIFGGKVLSEWFKQNLSLYDKVTVSIINPTRIFLAFTQQPFK